MQLLMCGRFRAHLGRNSTAQVTRMLARWAIFEPPCLPLQPFDCDLQLSCLSIYS